jgi:hypothetical protein
MGVFMEFLDLDAVYLKLCVWDGVFEGMNEG